MHIFFSIVNPFETYIKLDLSPKHVHRLESDIQSWVECPPPTLHCDTTLAYLAIRWAAVLPLLRVWFADHESKLHRASLAPSM